MNSTQDHSHADRLRSSGLPFFSLTLYHLPGSINLPYHVNQSHDNSGNSLPSHFGLYFSKKINSQFKDLQKNVPPVLYINVIIY